MEGFEVLHQTEDLLRLGRGGRLLVDAGPASFTYHDPCELGRGSGIYEQPRELIRMAGRLEEPAHNRSEALCCGSSLADTVIDDGQQVRIGRAMTAELEATGAETIVTACPLCKKAIVRNASVRVVDIAQVVAEHLYAADGVTAAASAGLRSGTGAAAGV